ncbi:MarR family winged helix-turn-helix transcriptional regulator [Sneathiella glossodoripedis]|uniref:MarR family winged helix-turn-helix transcriptional regulator n=1 Tax=Sneathiella glossodoripedis TaxID=418853 RepID=UPI000470BC09|nr:MarR family transcriptional regulator [Sneathiella glossodoripedis]
MADVKSGTNPLFLREEELRQSIELLFFAYRDFTDGPDQILKDYNFGRAHHRVIHFVGRNPGITVSELLEILRITKQSLSRVLNALVERGFVEQKAGVSDRRQRLLYLTDEGKVLERKISHVQQQQVAKAFREAGGEAVAGYRKVLEGLINEADRDKALSRIMKK